MTASKKGYVNLSRELGKTDYCVAYAHAELDSIHARETVLKCGSDDGIKVWLNGQVVHEHDAMRGYTAGSDEVAIRLNDGTNRLLVKVSNVTANWGFGVSIPKANF